MQEKKRPDFLSALCILTFIGSSIAFFAYFFASVFFERSTELIIKYSSWSSAGQISPLFFTLLMTLYAASLIGAIRMWKLHRDGFIIYTTAQFVIVILPLLWTNSHGLSATNIIFTAVFIAGYSLNLKWLR